MINLGGSETQFPAPTDIQVSSEFMREAFNSTFGEFQENWAKGNYAAINIQEGGLPVLEKARIKYDFIFLGDYFDRLLEEQETVKYDYNPPFLIENNDDLIQQKISERIKSEEHGEKLSQLLKLVGDSLEKDGVAVMVCCSLRIEDYFEILEEFGFRFNCKSSPNGGELENSRYIVFRNNT